MHSMRARIDANAAAIKGQDDRSGQADLEDRRAQVISSEVTEAIAEADRDRDVKAATRGHSIGNAPGFAVTNHVNAGNRWYPCLR
jgi:hypothetical protein